MSLIVKVGILWSATKVIFQDQTGAYDATNNPGGYGAPNPAFGFYAHYAIIRKKYAGITPDAVLTVDAYNPITDTQFTAARAVDGWYEATKLNIIIWTAGTYGPGTVRYYAGNVYIATVSNSVAPNSDPTKWSIVTDLTTIESNTTVIATISGRVTAYNADVYWSQWGADIASDNAIGVNLDDRQTERFYKIRTNILLTLAADQLGNNIAGEVCVNRLQLLGAK